MNVLKNVCTPNRLDTAFYVETNKNERLGGP